MRLAILSSYGTLTCALATGSLWQTLTSSITNALDFSRVAHLTQIPLMAPYEPSTLIEDSRVILSDVLSRHEISIFSGILRDVDELDKRISNPLVNSTILAPTNSAMTALPRKPWEDPKEYESFGTNAYSGEDGEERVKRNMRKFVEAHIVNASPVKLGDELDTLVGGKIRVEEEDGHKMVCLFILS